MSTWITAIVLGLVCAYAVSADMKQRKSERSKWWFIVGFLFSIFGLIAYMVWDRWAHKLRKRNKATKSGTPLSI